MKTEKIARLLPEMFQATVGSSGPLDAYLAAQEQLHEPCESAISQFPEHLSPRTAAPAFVYMLAYWTDLDYLLDGSLQAPHFAAGVGRLRELIASAARNGRERGTERACGWSPVGLKSAWSLKGVVERGASTVMGSSVTGWGVG